MTLRWTPAQLAELNLRRGTAPPDTDGFVASRKKPRELEHEEQKALFDWAELKAREIPELRLMFAIPNGGWRHAATAGKLKTEGVRPGVPDVCLPVARAGFNALYVEMKAGKNRPSPEQNRWLADLAGAGNRCYVAYSWKAARDLVVAYLSGSPKEGSMHR